MSPTSSPGRQAQSAVASERLIRKTRRSGTIAPNRHPCGPDDHSGPFPIYIMTPASSDDRSAGLFPEAAFAISSTVKSAPTIAGERPGTPAGERTSSICSCERAPQSGCSHRLVLACSCAVRREPHGERGATQLHPRTVLFSQDVSVGTPRPLLEAAHRRRRPDRRPAPAALAEAAVAPGSFEAGVIGLRVDPTAVLPMEVWPGRRPIIGKARLSAGAREAKLCRRSWIPTSSSSARSRTRRQ